MKKKIGAVLLVIIIALALGLPAPPARAASIIYVDADASGGDNDGTSWSDAYTDLQSTLASAKAGREIWVAAGTYEPGTDRSVSFQLDSGQKVYGGFNGTETTREQRDWVVNPTILSGDIGNEDDNNDNSYHVVTSEDTKGAILDGFTVTGGNANAYTAPDNSGGGIYNTGELTVNNCTFSNNSASKGGGVYNYEGTLIVNSSSIYENTATLDGGGLVNYRGKVTLKNSILSNNSATGTNQGGGGIYLADGPLALINSIVNGNTSAAQGGGIRAGGACELTIINSTIVNNTANEEGGGIRLGQTNVITNSIVWDNDASEGDQVYQPSGVQTNTVTYSVVEGEYNGGVYPGTGNINQGPQFVHAYDDLHLQYDSPAIDKGNNRAVSINIDLDGNPRIVDGSGDGVAIVDMGAFEYLTAPQVATQVLIGQVGELVDSEVLNPGQGNSLIVKLEAAFDKMYRNDNTAIKQLEAFINQVEGILSQEEGELLIEAANAIIEQL